LPGVDYWISEDHQAVVTTGQCESKQAMMAGHTAVRTAHVATSIYDKRESRHREVFTLASCR
jgi:hypothetical protein